MLGAIADDWKIFWREWHAGYFGTWQYVCVKLGLELLLLRVIPSLVFGAIFYQMMGLRSDAGIFLQFELTARRRGRAQRTPRRVVLPQPVRSV